MILLNTLSPARVVSVDILADDEYAKEALVIVPDDQLSLAIGRGGQNVRLAHKLTGWKIDIKSVSQAETMERNQEMEQAYEEPVEEEELENDIMEDDDNQEEYGVDEDDVAALESSEDDSNASEE